MQRSKKEFISYLFDEADLTIGSPISCSVKVNHVVELTAEEKEEARVNTIKHG